MFACELVGIALCYIFLPMIYINSYSAQIALAQIIYTLTLFFLRIAVMDNNALLNCFPLPYRVTLSLVFNFVGFASALLSLLVCWLLTRDEQLISNEKLVFVWALLTTFIALFTYLCPSDSVPYSTKQPVKTVVYRSFARMGTTLLALKNDVEYRRVLWFLLSYLFFSTSGTVFTIYVVTFFIDIYNSDTNDSTIVNMYYLVCTFIQVSSNLLVISRNWYMCWYWLPLPDQCSRSNYSSLPKRGVHYLLFVVIHVRSS